MRIGKLRMAVAAFGAVALVTATARCGSAQEKVEVEEQDGKSAPFMVRSGSFGGGTYLGVYISEVDADDVSQLGLKREYGAVSYTHLTLPTMSTTCRSRWSPYH